MEDKKTQVVQRIQSEIEKLDNLSNHFYFMVFDTKGTASGSLEYIYRMAYTLKENGYNVTMLHQETEFVGVKEWLGEEYASLPHENINGGEIAVSPSDVLFIPEIFSQVMVQTKNLPCKRVAILQNYDWMLEQMPFASKWNTFGIGEAVVNTISNAARVQAVFPAVQCHIVKPCVSEEFANDVDVKKMVVNIYAPNQSDISRIVKPFYWKYPNFNWLSFKDLRGMSKQAMAEELKNGAITIWVDEEAPVGYTALEAMKSGSIVLAKSPKNDLGWNLDEKGELINCCIWFDTFDFLHKQLANVVRAWTMDKVPSVLTEKAKEVVENYCESSAKEDIIGYIKDLVTRRKMEMTALLNNVQKEKED